MAESTVLSKRQLPALFFLILSVCLFCFRDIDAKICTWLAVVTCLVLIWNFLRLDETRITLSSGLLLYTMAVQFGMVIPYLLIGKETMSSYTDYTLRFMESPYLSKAILLGIIAVTSMQMGTMASRITHPIESVQYPHNIDDGTGDTPNPEGNAKPNGGYGKNGENPTDLLPDCTAEIIEFPSDEEADKKTDTLVMYLAGSAALGVVLLFFVISVLLGRMKFADTYTNFRNTATYSSSLYHYMMIVFYVGAVYLSAAGDIRSHKIGWLIWAANVAIFALNGNKGEFMYSLLAVVGIKGIQGQKINLKMLIAGALLLFVAIPTITALRSTGIAGNLKNAQLAVFEPFGEMGMQIRMSVYTLQDMANGTYGYLWGKSYIQPIVNMLTPFMKHAYATNHIKALYPGHGYSQIIESYLNFSIPGVILYHLLVGWGIGRAEILAQDRAQLAYAGTVTCVLINASRNYFAFVPGHLVLVTAFYFLVKRGISRLRF